MRVLYLTVAAALLPTVAVAQDSQSLFGSPSIMMQPGIVKSLAEDTDVEFNARFLVVIPTAIPRTALIGILEWTPFRSVDSPGSGASYTLNSPVFTYGVDFTVVDHEFFSAYVDVLLSYSASGSNPPTSDFTHKLLFPAAAYLKLGNIFNASGQLRDLKLYGIFAYVATGLDDPDAPTPPIRLRDRSFVLTGLSLPLAPWK